MAIVIVAVIFITLTTGLQMTIHSQQDQRFRHQAGAMAVEELETMRAIAWDALELSAAPPAGTPHTNGVTLTGADFDLPADESLVIGPGSDGVAGVVAATSTVQLDNQDFEIHRYVTASATGVRRVVVEVEWTARGHARTYWTSTQIAEVGAP